MMPKSVVSIGEDANTEEPVAFTLGHLEGMGAMMEPRSTERDQAKGRSYWVGLTTA
jgi:hypothetical protein